MANKTPQIQRKEGEGDLRDYVEANIKEQTTCVKKYAKQPGLQRLREAYNHIKGMESDYLNSITLKLIP